MVDLHERLSEFSYGYGVTREAETLLKSVGLKPTPFLPNLVQEKKLGFDVKFDKPGAVLFLQFKLGQRLKRFVRRDFSKDAPSVDRPFWRFKVDTAEKDGQFETLLSQQRNGGEVYYVAPRFSDWSEYIDIFQEAQVLEKSILIPPAEIRAALDSTLDPDGVHRIVYDQTRFFVCSEAREGSEVRPQEVAHTMKSKIIEQETSLRERVDIAYRALSLRSEIRRKVQPFVEGPKQEIATPHATIEQPAPQFSPARRSALLENLSTRTSSKNDALAAALSLEAWSLGIQTIFVELDQK